MATKSRQVVTNPFYKGGGYVGRKVTNPYFNRMRESPGRPRQGAGSYKTVVKSVRLAPEIWKRLKAQAEREGKTLHAALRQAVLIWLQS